MRTGMAGGWRWVGMEGKGRVGAVCCESLKSEYKGWDDDGLDGKE